MKEYVDKFILLLIQKITEKLDLMNLNSVIRIIYEVSVHYKILNWEYFRASFENYFLQIDLKQLNNFDFITVGYIMKKY